MKVLKKLGVMGLVLGLTMGAVGCSNGSEDNKDDSAKKDEIVILNVSAAASLQEAMVELEEKFKEVEPNVKLELNLGSSGSLQQQIEQGAACDVFISAGQKQMTALADKDLLLDGTNKTLLTNDLVLVTGEDKEIKDLDTLATDKVEKSTKRLANTGKAETNTGLAGLGLAVLGSLLAVAKRRKKDEE